MEYRTLGPLEVRHHGESLQLGGVKQRSLLALLLLHNNEVVSTDRLIDAVWAGTPPVTARQSLHNFVAALRRTLSSGRATPVLHTCDPGYRLDVRPGELDLERFRRLVDDARRALGSSDATTAARCLRVALALWRGPFLADLSDAGVEWACRPTVSDERLAALELRIDADLALGHHDAVVAELESLVNAYPLRERFSCQLILALYRCGRQADALAAYRVARETIVAQLGVEPGRELQALHHAVLAQHPSLGGERVEVGRQGTPSQAGVLRARDERRPVTVVLASVDGTAAWAEHDDPEDVRRVLAAGLDTVRGEIMRAGGVVPHVFGSTAMGLFGVPHAREDDAERGVRAALAIRDATAPDDRTIRVAVATGEALLMSDPGPGESAVAGHVVTAGTGLLEVAPAGSVLVTPATARATQRHVAYRAIELPSVAGRPAPAAFEAARVSVGLPFVRAGPDGAGRDGDALTTDATPWRGRERELELLVFHFDRVRRGDPGLVTVIGEAGLGKSRLIAELAGLLRRRGSAVTWRVGRTPSYGAAMPMRALHDLVKQHAGIMETDAAPVAARKLDAVLLAAIADTDQRAWVGRHLRALAGNGAADHDESGRQHEAFAAWSRFLVGLAGTAGATPLVLVFEELHWADDALLDFVAGLPERAGSAPLLVLALATPELLDRRPSWAVSSPASSLLRLTPLAEENMAALAADLVERHGLPSRLASTLVERAGGNPLFAEEYARMLADPDWRGGAVARQRARRLPLPESVHTIIAARLDRLRDDDRRVLEDAAVVGRVAWTGVIAAVGDHEPAALEASLRRLERLELIRRVPVSHVAGQAEYTFAHVLVRDVAYSRIPRAARVDKHSRAAAWIDTLPGHGATDRAELLAHHFQEALKAARGAGQRVDDLEVRAGIALRAAGDRAAGLGAYGAAARWYANALDLWPVTADTRAELLFRLGAARFYQEGDGERTLRSARNALLEIGDRGRAAEAEVMLGLVAWRRGDNDRAMMLRARELVRGSQRPRSKAFVLSRCALRFAIDDQPDAALTTGAEALRLAEDLGLVEDAAKASTAIGMARISQGQVDGLDDLRRAAGSLERARSPAAANALINLATMRAWLGDLAGCFGAQARARAVAEHFASAAELRWLEAEAILERYWTGDVALAAARAQQFIVESTATERHYLEPSCRVVRGRFLLERGRISAANRDAAQALSLARTADDVQMLVPALLLQARVVASTGDVAAASRKLDEALDALRGRLLLPEIGIDLAIVIGSVRSDGALDALDDAGIAPSPWLDATRAFVAGDPAAAAAIYARIGSAPDAQAAAANALVRVRSA